MKTTKHRLTMSIIVVLFVSFSVVLPVRSDINSESRLSNTITISIPVRMNDLDGYEDPTFHVSGDAYADDWVGTETSVMTGWIFTDVQIPKGSTISNAYVQFRGFGNGGDATARIAGFAQDNAEAFLSNGSNKPSTRPITAAFVDWTNTWTFQWQWFQTPDLSAIVQEVINRPAWVSGNSIGFQISNSTGTGTNWAVVDFAAGPYDGSGGAGHSVTLYIEYVSPSVHKVFLPLISNSSSNVTSSPSWRILVLTYSSTDFIYTDNSGQQHHFVADMTQAERDKVVSAVTRFVNEDIPALNSYNMRPTVTISYPAHALSSLSPMGCDDYAPSPSDAAPDRDSAFDSVISIWDGSGTDLITGQSMSIQGCAWAWGMGIGQTYVAIPVDYVQHNDRNVFKHEWGHSIIFYYNAAGTAPRPPVNNHINDTTNRYVNCITGQSYILQDETDDNPIPNSIYNNESGFTHDYYSGITATADQPTRCLGITPNAWASGGPVSRPLSSASDEVRWHSPSDDIVTTAVPYR